MVWVFYWGDQMDEMGWTCFTMGERKGVYRVLVKKPERKRPLGRPRLKWDDNIKVARQESGMGGHGVDGVGLGQGQVAGTCECGNEPSGSIRSGEFLDWLKTG